jgi:hypothetical protein
VNHKLIGAILGAAWIGAAATAGAAPRKLAPIAVAVDRRLEADAVATGVALMRLLKSDARFEALDLTSLAQGEARALKAKKGLELLTEALNLLDEMKEKAALQKVSEAIAAYEEADLSSAFPGLLDAMAARAFAYFFAGDKAQVKAELVKLYTLRPDYALDARRTSPPLSALAAEARASVASAPRTNMEVRSSPVPAEVFVDGIFRGIAPQSVGGLSPGGHYLTLRAPGYELAQERTGALPTVQGVLQREPGEKGLFELLRAIKAATPPGSGGSAAALARWAGADEALVVGLQRRDEGTWAVVTRTSADGRQLATAQGALKRPDAIDELAREVLAAPAPEASLPASEASPGATQARRGEPARSSSDHDLPAGDRSWLLNGLGLGTGQTALLAEIGWPGVQVSLLHGLAASLDVGGFAAFDFGLDGIITSELPTAPGLRLGGIARLSLVNQPRFNLGLRLSPGLALYFTDSTLFGFIVPLEVVAGLPLAPQLSLHFGLAVPLTAIVAPDTAFVLSFLAGVGLEYKVSDALSLTIDSRLGPAIDFSTSSLTAYFQLRAVLGVGYRF